VPDLPKAHYEVWVRGYGLVDSPKVAAEPGRILKLTAETAPSLAAAAQYYPAIYWASMIKIPDPSRFPGTGDKGNGIPETFKTSQQWLNFIKTNGCGNCHQIGNFATRTIPASLGQFESSEDAWARRLQSGPAGHDMVRFIAELMTPDGGHLKALADWTDRVKAGELPSRTPPRPIGMERNLVVTVRDWLDAKHYLHDLIATDQRSPTVNGYGPIYGATELSTDDLPILDPVHNTKTVMRVPVRDPDAPSSASVNLVEVASPYWGIEQTWDSRVNAHNPIDGSGRARLIHGPVAVPETPAGLLQERFAAALGATLPARTKPRTALYRTCGRSPFRIPRPRNSRSSTLALAHIILILGRMSTTLCGSATTCRTISR
jgi:hypothetical protein